MPSSVVSRLASSILAMGLAELCASRAMAHGPTEVFQIVSGPADEVIVATSRGLLFGTPSPRTWSLLCSERMGLATGQPYSTAVLEDGRVLLAALGALRVSDDGGCSFRELALSEAALPFMVQDPRAPAQIFLVAARAGVASIYGSADAGEHFRPLLTLPEGANVRSLLLAPSAPLQLFVSWFVEDSMGGREHALASSRDAGEHWQMRKIELDEGERDLTLLALSPKEPTQLLARASSNAPSLGERVLWSDEGASPLQRIESVRMLRSASFSADGRSLYLGGVDGVAWSRDPLAGFAPLGAARWINYVTSRGDGLFAAGYYAGIDARLHGIGVARPSDTELQPWMSFNQVMALKACSNAAEPARVCEAPLRDWLLDHPAYEGPAPSYVEASPRALLAPLQHGDTEPADERDAGQDGQVDELHGDAAAAGPTLFDAGSAAPLDAGDAASAMSTGAPHAAARRDTGCAVHGSASARASLLTCLLFLVLSGLRRTQGRSATGHSRWKG